MEYVALVLFAVQFFAWIALPSAKNKGKMEGAIEMSLVAEELTSAAA